MRLEGGKGNKFFRLSRDASLKLSAEHKESHARAEKKKRRICGAQIRIENAALCRVALRDFINLSFCTIVDEASCRFYMCKLSFRHSSRQKATPFIDFLYIFIIFNTQNVAFLCDQIIYKRKENCHRRGDKLRDKRI
jgi:polyphosphate kinase